MFALKLTQTHDDEASLARAAKLQPWFVYGWNGYVDDDAAVADSRASRGESDGGTGAEQKKGRRAASGQAGGQPPPPRASSWHLLEMKHKEGEIFSAAPTAYPNKPERRGRMVWRVEKEGVGREQYQNTDNLRVLASAEAVLRVHDIEQEKVRPPLCFCPQIMLFALKLTYKRSGISIRTSFCASGSGSSRFRPLQHSLLRLRRLLLPLLRLLLLLPLQMLSPMLSQHQRVTGKQGA